MKHYRRVKRISIIASGLAALCLVVIFGFAFVYEKFLVSADDTGQCDDFDAGVVGYDSDGNALNAKAAMCSDKSVISGTESVNISISAYRLNEWKLELSKQDCDGSYYPDSAGSKDPVGNVYDFTETWKPENKCTHDIRAIFYSKVTVTPSEWKITENVGLTPGWTETNTFTFTWGGTDEDNTALHEYQNTPLRYRAEFIRFLDPITIPGEVYELNVQVDNSEGTGGGSSGGGAVAAPVDPNSPTSVEFFRKTFSLPKGKITGVGDAADYIATALEAIIGLLAFVSLIMGSIQYITSGGDSAKAEKAKKIILYAIIGIVLTILARVITVIIINSTSIAS